MAVDADRSLKTCFGSRNLGSMCFGAWKSRQTTKISAETLLNSQPKNNQPLWPSNNFTARTIGSMHVPRRGRLRCLDLPKQLVEDPDEVVVIHTTEDLGHERPALDEELDGEFETHEHELGLRVGILYPGCTDVGSTVVQDDICFPVFELAAEEVAAVGGGDVGGEGGDAGDGFYWD